MNQTRERFVTDGVGNRLTKEINSQTETYTYVGGTNRLQEITGPVSYTYDANGNITGIGTKVLTYNQNNRLVRVEENSNILGEYTYNGMGQRVIKAANGVTTVFHYDFNGNIIGESLPDGTFSTEYLYKGNSRLALVDVASGDIYSFLNDRLGTPQMLADSTNTIVWEGIYKPFGEADVNPNSSVVNNFRFPGQYYDEETGFHYNYHRYYDSQTGRYLTTDPIGLAGGINLWIYANANPINFFDPIGLRTLYETFYSPFIKKFQKSNPVEHYLFKQYASGIDVDDWPCETEGWMKNYARAWKDFDPYARDNAISVLGSAYVDFIKGQYGPLSWIAAYLNNFWGVLSGAISGAGTTKSISRLPKTTQEVLDVTFYGPKVINEKIFTEAFGNDYAHFIQ